ncbi:hypothetical protein ACJMK2_017334 [Sinanodonta woodiana]|uniref:Uncharacterized protein n=1 Tax=Sinanodonta woodiana TaxID=1069815 RepID=A0ABD3UZV8_SINWO
MHALRFQNVLDEVMESYKSLLMRMKEQCQQLPIMMFFSHTPRYPLPTPSTTSVEEDDDAPAEDTAPPENSPTEVIHPDTHCLRLVLLQWKNMTTHLLKILHHLKTLQLKSYTQIPSAYA